MIMLERVADESVEPATVLVVNEALVPYFEGVQEVQGKMVGIRLETIGYALPRDIEGQSAEFLEQMAGALSKAPEELTDKDMEDYLSTRSSRPPELQEHYHPALDVQGQTQLDGDLYVELPMDAFHNKNPFRHAYHPQLGAGFTIDRILQIHFDERPQYDRLSGAYQETLIGLANDPVTVRGRINLKRVSPVDTLQF
jgi:hypothetical protein